MFARPSARSPRRSRAIRLAAVPVLAVMSTCIALTGSGTAASAAQLATSAAIAPHESFPLVSSSYSIKGDATSQQITASCPDGYYVRAGVGSAWDPTAPRTPSVWINTDNTPWIKVKSLTPQDFYWSSATDKLYKTGPYRSFKIQVYSATPYDHKWNFQWWCDALSPWTPHLPDTTTVSATANPDIEPPEPWGPDCDYCSRFYDVVENDGNGMVMNNAGAQITDGNPVISWPDTKGARNQQWHFKGLGTKNYIPTFSIWTGPPGPVLMDTGVIVENQSTHQLTIKTSAGGTPAGGTWEYLDGYENAYGPTGGDQDSIMLVNTQSDRCLAATPGQGDTLTTLPCNTWDTYQWWTVGSWKK